MSDNPLILQYQDGSLQPYQAPDPGNALQRAYELTGIPDLVEGAHAAARGEYLPALGQVASGAAALLPPTKIAGAAKIGAELAGLGGIIRGFHGTPHTFSEFRSEAIGSGEGAQSFGWGHYVAGNQGVGERYKNKLGGAAGNLLEVHILPDEHELLDLDKPLTEQSPHVQQALKKLPWDSIDSALENANMNPMSDALDAYTGRHLYSALKHPEVHDALPAEVPGSSWYEGNTREDQHTSMYLHSIGIPGLQYLDRGSRRTGEGTRNYVIFDPSNLRIVGRNGQRLEPVDHDPFGAK